MTSPREKVRTSRILFAVFNNRVYVPGSKKMKRGVGGVFRNICMLLESFELCTNSRLPCMLISRFLKKKKVKYRMGRELKSS